MRLWLDAQLPPQIAPWLSATFHLEAATLESIGLRHAPDRLIFDALRKPGEVIVSKDEDFLDLVARLGSPPQLIWVTCGNVTNRALQQLCLRALPETLRLIQSGEPVVELASR